MAVKLEIRPTRPDDAARLEAFLRDADRLEVEAASGQDALSVIEESIAATLSPKTALFDGELACIFGVCPVQLLGPLGIPWMLGTDKLDRHPSVLLRHCRRYIADMNAAYPHLLNYVDARNKRSVRWLKAMGFKLHPAEPYGAQGLPFHLFEMRRASHV